MLQALRRRWVSAILIGGVLALVAGGAAYAGLEPKPVAFAKVRVAYTHESIFKESGGSPTDFRAYLQTAAAQITSRPVIVSALKREEVKRLNLEQFGPDPVEFVEENLKVEFKEPSELLTITFTCSDPHVATVVTNAVKDSYLDDIVYAESQGRLKRFNELEKARDAAKDNLATTKSNLRERAKDLGGITDAYSWAQQRQELLLDLRETRNQQHQVGFKLYEARATLEAHDLRMKLAKEGGGIANSPNVEALVQEALENDADIKYIRGRIEQVENLYERFAGNPTMPTAVNIRNRLVSLRASIEKRKSEVRSSATARARRAAETPAGVPANIDPVILRAQYQKAIDTLTELEGNLKVHAKELTAEVAKLARGEELEALKEQAKREEELVADLGRRVERERVEIKAAPRISRFQDAELMRKETKKQVLATAVAPIAMFGAVCMGLALYDFRQRRIRSASQVSRGLGIRVVGAVPEVPNLERQLVGPSGEPMLEGQPVLESIDALRTVLLHEAGTNATRVVMVTSATAGEGKTTLASHLATSLARAGRKTLLIDGDLRRPTVHELFEAPMQPGLSEVLLGEVEATEACQDTNLETLAIVPAGQWDREVLQALAGDSLEGALEKLQQEFDFIVIDSHPVLPATDSLLIGRQADAVILSVRREVSQMPKVYAAAQRLTGLGIRVLGAVVNGTDPEEALAAGPVAAPAVTV
jgi:capsular exopolysaccharide synthesis family protein